MRVAYIAGPYGADTPEEIAENIKRALALGKIAAGMGFAPIVPHTFGSAIYGSERGECGDEPDPHARERALKAGEAIAFVVGLTGGALFMLEKPDGSLSEGTGMEYRAYMAGCKAGRWDYSVRWFDHDLNLVERTP